MEQSRIRNFSIIAHVDHGKSTLADRLLEVTKAVDPRLMKAQMLDSLDIERERGITIKSQVATLQYQAEDGQTYYLNLIDTPGHVDFSYEVSRALAACEGVLLVIDASQGVEAQTLANMYQALEHDLEIIPVLNKIDLPAADLDRCHRQIEDELGLDPELAIPISAKMGTNIEAVLEAVVEHIPAPAGHQDETLQALIFDGFYDAYRGVVVSVRMMNGTIKPGQMVKFFRSEPHYEVQEVGIYRVGMHKAESLSAGEVGYIIPNVRTLEEARVGDTITHAKQGADKPWPGYRDVKPMVYAGIYPVVNEEYPDLQENLEKLQINDVSLTFEPEKSLALGFGFRTGFLGLLHLEIVQERLRREFNMEVITTFPSVSYTIKLSNGDEITCRNPAEYPDPATIDVAYEPYARVTIIVPNDYVGAVMQYVMEKRGIQKNLSYIDDKRAQLDYEMPMAEIIYEFHDRIKSVTRGYASYDYEMIEYRESDLVKVDILVNEEKVDAFSQIMHRDGARGRGKSIIERLKDQIPRHLFKIPLQAAIGGSIIARENISAVRKDVTAKCYGGDITRKRKLLEKQKEGKKKMRQFGKVNIPQEAFLSVLKSDSPGN